MNEKIGKREEKKIRAEKAILTAANKLFRERGFSGTSLALIMETAGLAVGTFYNYFGSKEEVLMNLLKNLFSRVGEKVAEGRAENKNSSELLELACMLTAEIVDENRFVLPLLRSSVEHSDNPEKMPPNSSPGFGRIFDEIIKEGQRRKEFRADIPPELISELFHSIYQAAAYSRINISFRENIGLKLKIILSGLCRRD